MPPLGVARSPSPAKNGDRVQRAPSAEPMPNNLFSLSYEYQYTYYTYTLSFSFAVVRASKDTWRSSKDLGKVRLVARSSAEIIRI